MNSVMTLRWNHGGRNVSSPTSQRGGKIAKSTVAVPARSEGAVIWTEASFGTPRTLVGDLFAKSKKKPKVEGVVEKMVLEDSTRRLELDHVNGLEHSDSMLIAYLPKEKILFSADFNAPPDSQPVSPSIATLMANLDRLAIDGDRIKS